MQAEVKVLEQIADREHRRRVLVLQEAAFAGRKARREAKQDRKDLLAVEPDCGSGGEQLGCGCGGDAQHAVGDQLQPLRLRPLADVTDLTKLFKHWTSLFEVGSISTGEDQQLSALHGGHAADNRRFEQTCAAGIRLTTQLLRDLRPRRAGFDQ